MEQHTTEKDTVLERLLFLSDGVFAIAITLVVLEINVPEIPSKLQQAHLPGMLLGLVPSIATYALSFLIVSVYWISHHSIRHGTL